MTNTWQQSSKLVELRSKTDRQLLELVTRALETAMCLARTGEDRLRAERACDQVRRLLPVLPKSARRRVESRLAELAETLRPTAQAACF